MSATSDSSERPRLLRKVGGIALLLLSFTLAALVIRYQPEVDRFIRSIGGWAYPMATIVFAIVASAPFSVTDALAVMNGAIFGPLWGSVINAVGLVLAAMLGYWVNRHATHLLDLDAYLKRLPAWTRRFKPGSPMFLICVRVIPGFGGTAATATAAVMRVPLIRQIYTMCAVAIPICTLLAIGGDRVTILVHGYERRAGNAMRRYERRAKVYIDKHANPFHIHFRRVRPTPLPSTPPPSPIATP